MAEPKQEKKTFKWGDQEYLLDDLLKVHMDQEQNFYNFARDRGQYDDTALAGLRAAISSRINAVKEGRSFEGDGILDGDVVDNVRIQTKKRGLRKKDKYVDQDNTEWAKYYLGKLVGQLKPYQKKQQNTNKWDPSKYGLGSYLTGQGYNAKDIFEQYDLQDKANPKAARSYAQRRALLKEQLLGYKTWLEGKGFDFKQNDNEWDDNFNNDLSDLITNFDSLDNKQITARLRKLGAGDAYTTAFTSDRWDLTKTDAQLEADAKKTDEEEAQKRKNDAWSAEVDRRWGIYSGSTRRNGQMNKYIGKDSDFTLSDDDLQHHLETTKISGEAAEKQYWDDLDAKYKANPYDGAVAQIILPLKARQGRLGNISKGNYTGWMYDPATVDEARQSVLAFDPATGKMEEIFIGNVESDWNNIKSRFMYDNGYESESAQFKKEGGSLYLQSGGEFSSYAVASQFKKERNAARAQQMGNTEEHQKAMDRVVSTGEHPLTSDDPTLASPDAGFSGADKARLVSIGADIASIFLDPVSGAITNVGSTLTNFVADWADDGLDWGDVKNLGINLGLDLVSLVPVVGDAVGVGGKVIRTAVKWAPRMLAGLAAMHGVANLDGMMTSWKKITSGDALTKMTVQDWRNIQQSISLIAGGANVAKRKAAQNQMKAKAQVKDAVSVTVREKSSGEIKQILVDGDVAKGVRDAKGVKADVEAALSKAEPLKGKFGTDDGFEVVTKGRGGLQNPWQKVNNPDGSTSRKWMGFHKEGRAAVAEVFDFSKVPEGYGHYLGIDRFVHMDHPRLNKTQSNAIQWVNSRGQVPELDYRGARTTYDAAYDKLMSPVKQQISEVQAAMTRRTSSLDQLQKQTKKTVSEIQALQKKLHGIKKVDVQAELAGFKGSTTGLQSLQVHHDRLSKQVDGLSKQLDVIRQKIQYRKSLGLDSSVLDKQRLNLESQIQTGQSSLATIQSKITELQLRGSERIAKEGQLEATLQDFDKLRILEQRKKGLEAKSAQAATTNHTKAYNKLQAMIEDLQKNHSKVEGKDVTWDMTKILQDAGLPNAFKSGGSINLNKLSKFLNYAKG